MWPRTAEERARGRNTGFVCFMTRDDAQEAMDAFQDNDPLRTGRRMCLRWGKNVKKSVKRGTGGVPIAPIRRKEKKVKDVDQKISDIDRDKCTVIDHEMTQNHFKRVKIEECIGGHSTKESELRVDGNHSIDVSMIHQRSNEGDSNNHPAVNIPVYYPLQHALTAIRVELPLDQFRLKFITTVASFVAKDGSILERKLIERESNNPKFSFLVPADDPMPHGLSGTVNTNKHNPEKIREQLFYRWRVFAFTQGDGFDSWQTKPFVMIQPHGRFWIPPSLDAEAARKEEDEAKKKEEQILIQQEERRKLSDKKDFMTGRQLEHAKFSSSATAAADGAETLNDSEMAEWLDILQNKLCASKDSICEAMAFCFDKSGAASQISELLRKAMLDDKKHVSVETRIARLYLISDVLFNSQQPGVKNAFRYRDAIEAMAFEIFENLGKHGQGIAGRLTMNKLRNAVSAVLSAWTKWSVYNPTFIEEIEAKFEGRELPSEHKDDSFDGNSCANSSENINEVSSDMDNSANLVSVREEVCAPRGDWVTENISSPAQPIINDDVDGEALDTEDVDGEALDDEDVDGEELLDNDVDEELIDNNDVDGEALKSPDENCDGEFLSPDDID